MSKNGFLQFELDQTAATIKAKWDEFDEQIPLLPIDQLQLKYDIDNVTLSKREYEIMQMVLTGWSIVDIAVKISLSIPGIKFRLSHIYAKFGVSYRLELIKKAFKSGLQFHVDGSPIKQAWAIRIDYRELETKETNEP